MTGISRRQLFRRAAAVVPALILPELLLPRRKVFAVGWETKEQIIIELGNERWERITLGPFEYYQEMWLRIQAKRERERDNPSWTALMAQDLNLTAKVRT